jgi:uncharacterized membrane protein YbhN (UPF0104 family)
MTQKTKMLALRLITILGIALGGFLLYRAFSRYSLEEIAASLRAIPARNILLALCWAAGSYLCLSVGDWLGLRHVGHPLAYRKVLLGNFVSVALGHSIGFAGLSSGAIRYRFYSRWGLDLGDVAKVVLFSGVTIALGMLSVGAIVLLYDPGAITDVVGIAAASGRPAGILMAGLVAAYVAAAFRRTALRFRTWTLAVPAPLIAVAQIVTGTANYACVAGCLYYAVAAVSEASYFHAISAFVVGDLAAIVMHVPGGLGVIEFAVMNIVPAAGSLVGALLVFRAAYYLVPLILGIAIFAAAEIKFRLAARRP